MHEVIELQERQRGSRCCDDTSAKGLTMAVAQQVSADMQILAHPVRLQLLSILACSAGQVCVCDLEAAVPVKQPTVSHHLRLLREAGLIDAERHGLWAYYFVKRDALSSLWARVRGNVETLV